MNTYNNLNVETIDVEIKKPLYDTYVNIRDVYVNKAINEGKLLRITIPQGTAIVDPKEWLNTGKVVKQVFLRPDEPMVLVGNNVPVMAKKGLAVNQLTLI